MLDGVAYKNWMFLLVYGNKQAMINVGPTFDTHREDKKELHKLSQELCF